MLARSGFLRNSIIWEIASQPTKFLSRSSCYHHFVSAHFYFYPTDTKKNQSSVTLSTSVTSSIIDAQLDELFGGVFFSLFSRVHNGTIFFRLQYLIQLIEHLILRIPNFNFPNLGCYKVCVFIYIMRYFGIFGCILISI